MNLNNLTRSELIIQLRRKSRKQLVEEFLSLHGELTTRRAPVPEGSGVTTFEVPLGTARAMAHLADANSRRRLKKQDPSLFNREPTAVELAAGTAAVWTQYNKIKAEDQSGVERRRSFRKIFASTFNQ